MTAPVWDRVPQTQDDTEEDAKRAVRAFQRILPTLSSFARAYTGRNIRVQMDSGTPRTNGDIIFLRPPIQLGRPVEHERSLCEKRDADKQLYCKACALREDVYIVLYHEIAHIAEGTFNAVPVGSVNRAITEAVKEVGGKYAEKIAEKIRNAPPEYHRSHQAISNLVSPFLPILNNALEDARVNRGMFTKRAGTKVMFDALIERIFSQGIDIMGKTEHWRDRPLNAQIMVGVFCRASGYEIKPEWFSTEVYEALQDVQLNEILARVDQTGSAAEVFELTFPVLARMRELGFCRNENDPEQEEPEPPQFPEAQPDSPQEGKDEPTDQSDSSDNSESTETGDSESTDSAEGSDSEDDSSSSERDERAPEDDDADDAGSDQSEEADSGDQSGDADESADGTDDEDGSGASAPDDSDGSEEETSDSGSSGTDAGSESESDGGTPEGEVDESPADAEQQTADGNQGTGDISGDPADQDDSGEREDQSESSEDGRDGGGSGSNQSDPVSGSPEESTGEGGTDEPTPGEGDPSQASPDKLATEEGTASPEPDSGTGEADRSEDRADGEVEPLDTGADKGLGGIDATDLLDEKKMGTPEDVARVVQVFGQHDERDEPVALAETKSEKKAIDVAVVQGMYFEKASAKVTQVRIHTPTHHVFDEAGQDMAHAWDSPVLARYGNASRDRVEYGIDCDMEIPEQVLGPALLRMRVAFSDNARAHESRNQKSGRVNGRVLGRRVHFDDPRLFKKKTIPGKKDYAVVIGIDVSGSTLGENIALIKRAAMAQAELCDRTGVSFAVYAHSGKNIDLNGHYTGEMALDIYVIKSFDEPWSSRQKDALSTIGPDSDNLDGHTLEFYRKRLDEVRATDKILMYYTDGKMPAANKREEQEILEREIRTCRQRGITLMAVGIRTSSPERHGFDTVQVDEDTDLIKPVKLLEKRLAVPL